MNLLQNSNFETGWDGSHTCLVPGQGYRDVGNIFTPPGWVTWFDHQPGEWDQPEVRDAWEQNDPRRVRSGDKAVLLFTFNRNHDAGFMQQVNVGNAGQRLRLSAYAHAWSNHTFEHADDPRWSEGAGHDVVAWPKDPNFMLTGDVQEDAKPNFTFRVGIDPTGGTDPLASTVVWGDVGVCQSK